MGLKQMMVEQLKQYILDHRLKVGDKLPTERQLAEDYQVSRSVVREALSYLENTGVTESVQGKGTLVKAHDITPLIDGFLFSFQVAEGDIRDLLMLRLTFELAAIDIIEQHQLPIDKIKSALVDDVNAFNAQQDQNFHQSILESVHSTLFQQMSAVVQAYFYRHTIVTTKAENQVSIKEHQAIYDALAHNDFRQAKMLLTQHLMKGEQRYD
ncbi:FadR family transcriptional regulator [Staphylococcus sp. H16/1A]|uniref:FadR family transcriptional regulator n=2 Tax=Staphylococcus canis TaxID=2724942 RepID=A0ABS0TA08_9STAP|nr:FadR family transcriptional regulator [Staphylococcus canis]